MIRILYIFYFIISLLIANDNYPYFSSAKKQLAFEKKGYIYENSGKRTITSGGVIKMNQIVHK